MNDSPAKTPWKILIADDDADVHATTRMALRGAGFRGRALEFLDAYSGAETLTVLQDNPDTAIVFLDVIMETEDAGLGTVRAIRDSGFNLVRIIIRTGFPGQAPERSVIVDYDIHDYKEKTGLSVQKLFTSVISALRAYDDLVALESHRRGLMSVLESVSAFDFNAVKRYVTRMLAEFINLARIGSGNVVAVSRRSVSPERAPTVLAAIGDWPATGDQVTMDDLPAAISGLLAESLERRQSLVGHGGRTLFSHHHGVDLVVFATGDDAFALADEVLLDVLLINVCQAISNQGTFADMASDRDAVLHGLALRAEHWDDRARRPDDSLAAELERLARLTEAVARRLDTTLGFPDRIDSCFLRDIGCAAMLHDLGNESISALLLAKSGFYAPEERAQMQEHVAAGVRALKTFSCGASQTGALELAREIVACHHERFDGVGYPGRLQGDAIPLAARLVAVADAYVAMTSPRPHRPALDASVACKEIKAGEGRQFDPRIVQAFLEVVDSDFKG